MHTYTIKVQLDGTDAYGVRAGFDTLQVPYFRIGNVRFESDYEHNKSEGVNVLRSVLSEALRQVEELE